MNLQKLFDMQRTLDAHIVKEHGLEGQDLLPQKILALQVELGECANEWRGFKFWSSNQKPRTLEVALKSRYKSKYVVEGFTKSGIRKLIIDDVEIPFHLLDDFYDHKNPLLEEYIDCLHFILSIGLDIGYEYEDARYLNEYNVRIYQDADGATQQFNNVFAAINHPKFYDELKETNYELYEELCLEFLGLGEMLGFKWEQIEETYMNKNKVNHERQDTNY